MVDASTQCEGLQTMDAQCQFPKDAGEAALADHTYCISVPQTQSSITTDNTTLKQRVFLVYEEKLKELLHFCPICGSLIISENTVETSNEGTQLSLTLNCMGSCTE